MIECVSGANIDLDHLSTPDRNIIEQIFLTPHCLEHCVYHCDAAIKSGLVKARLLKSLTEHREREELKVYSNH